MEELFYLLIMVWLHSRLIEGMVAQPPDGRHGGTATVLFEPGHPTWQPCKHTYEQNATHTLVAHEPINTAKTPFSPYPMDG